MSALNVTGISEGSGELELKVKYKSYTFTSKVIYEFITMVGCIENHWGIDILGAIIFIIVSLEFLFIIAFSWHLLSIII